MTPTPDVPAKPVASGTPDSGLIECITRDASNTDLPKLIGAVGEHVPQWETVDCPWCGSAPCGPHPDVLGCEFCSDDWPCGPVQTAAGELERIAADDTGWAIAGHLRRRAALLRGEMPEVSR